MEANVYLAKQLGMIPRTRGMRLSAQRPLPPRQVLRASAHCWQHVRHAGDRLGLPRKEQAQQDVQPSNTAGHLKYACHSELNHVARCGRQALVRLKRMLILKSKHFPLPSI